MTKETEIQQVRDNRRNMEGLMRLLTPEEFAGYCKGMAIISHAQMSPQECLSAWVMITCGIVPENRLASHEDENVVSQSMQGGIPPLNEPAKKETKTIGQRLRERREAKGWTQSSLGLLVSKHPTDISAYERGVKVPKPDTIRKLAKALRVHPTRIDPDLFSKEAAHASNRKP